jgi:flagellum-specific ATP synthase
MPKLNVEKLAARVRSCEGFLNAGRLVSARGVLTAELGASIGELCSIHAGRSAPVLSEVIGFSDGYCQLMPLEPASDLSADAMVVALNRRMTVPVGMKMNGRVIDAIGRPVDDKGPVLFEELVPLHKGSPDPMSRTPIQRPLVTGQRAIDGLLTTGVGQRIGLFAGSGVGKSTLLGEIARYSESDVNVVVLVGERGREVRPFIEDSLGEEGLARSVVIVSTAEQPALVRIRSAQTGLAIADWFRSRGMHVLMMIDSLTRLAWSQRELGLSIGEPPSSRGFTPGSLQIMANLVEQMGTNDRGAITGILTVLVDGDDTSEPVADSARSILDGHIVLSRKLAEKGHFPAIDIAASISRLTPQITTSAHQAAILKIRELLAEYSEIEDLIRVGAYQAGSVARLDRAIRMKPAIDAFLRQPTREHYSMEQTLHAMNLLLREAGDVDPKPAAANLPRKGIVN